MNLHCCSNKIISAVAFSVLLSSGFGCSSSSGSSEDFEGYAEIVSAFPDSIEQEEETHEDIKPEDIKIEIPEIQLMTFPDVEAVMTYMKESPDSGRYKRGIIPNVAAENLDYAIRLLNNLHEYFIVVDKSRMKVILFNRFGETVKEYGMACAKNYGTKHKKRDGRTPEGFFKVKGIYNSTEWLYTDDDGRTSDKKGQFGPRFIRLQIPGTSQIGIHGTCAPWSIGSRASHGCIRLTNENILELVQYAEKKMPVIIVPGKKDMQVNISEGYDIPWIPTLASGGKRPKTEESVPAGNRREETTAAEVSNDSIISE